MRELQLLHKAKPIAFADAEGRSAPFAHAIQRQDRRRLKWTGEKCARSMTFMVVCKNQPGGAGLAQLLLQSSAHVQFVLQPKRHRHPKTAKTGRRVGEVSFQEPIKLGQRLVVKRDVSQLVRLDAAFLQAISDGAGGKTCIVLFATETLLLRRSDNVPVHNQRGGTVVIKGRDA